MRCFHDRGTRDWPHAAAAAWLAMLMFNHPTAQAEGDALHVVRVEEDWELVVGDPDTENNAPQVTAVMSPGGNLDGYYVALEVNFQSQPAYAPGGVHLQLWQGAQCVATKKFPDQSRLAVTGEVVRWTQSMTVENGVLQFEVTDGDSQTWGDFGGQGYLKIAVDGAASHLDNYRPEVSVAHSGVCFAKNRVQSLTLKQVRVTASNGTVVTDQEPRSVFEQE